VQAYSRIPGLLSCMFHFFERLTFSLMGEDKIASESGNFAFESTFSFGENVDNNIPSLYEY
jgi:hypothetical protein